LNDLQLLTYFLLFHVLLIFILDRLLQVGDDISCPHLNSAEGERALLIKDAVGDWGIVHGKWVGFRKGVPGKPGRSPLSLAMHSQLQPTTQLSR